MNTPRATIVGLLVTALSGAMYACSVPAADRPADSAEPVGTLSAALTALGPDGATYTLPTSAYIALAGLQSDAGTPPSQTLVFNTLAGTQSFNLPAGTYSATLNGGPADGGLWSLGRTADGGTSSVPAQLTDPQPYLFTIAPGQSTSITFHFTAIGVGAITFSNGTLTTGLQVGTGTAPPGHVLVSGSFTLQPASSSINIPSLTSVLTTTGSPTVTFTESLTLTGPFTSDGDYACANVVGTVLSATVSADAGVVGTNLDDLVQEASNGTGQICIADPNFNSGSLSINVRRTGPALTTPFFDALNATDAGASDGGGVAAGFELSCGGIPTPALYNGTTLNFQTVALQGGLTSGVVYLGSSYAYIVGLGPLSVQFAP